MVKKQVHDLLHIIFKLKICNNRLTICKMSSFEDNEIKQVLGYCGKYFQQNIQDYI